MLEKVHPEVAQNCRWKEFIYSDYEESDLNDLEQSDLIFVTLHNNGLVFKAKDQLQTALDRGAKIYALNLSHEYDAELQDWGICFDPWVLAAFKNGRENNMMNIVLKKLNNDCGFDCSYAEIEEVPLSGIYNYKSKQLHRNISSYLEERGEIKKQRPWIGVIVGKSDLTKSQYLYVDQLIRRLEEKGFNVLPVFSSQQPGHQEEQVIERFFVPSDTIPRVRMILNLGCWYNVRPEQERTVLQQLGIPVVNGIILNCDQQTWEKSSIGIDMYNRSNLLAIPELAGYINPSVSVVLDDLGDKIRIKKMIDYQLEVLLGRIQNICNLQMKPNREKKVALIYYSYPPGKENIGASYLNVLPGSILSVLQRMRLEGYDTGGQPIDSASIFNRIMHFGRNIGSWAPAEIDKLVKEGDPVLIPMEIYEEWYHKLPLKIRTEMENSWGKPEESRLMVWKDRLGHSYFVVPVVRYGNILLTAQPPRGWEEQTGKLYHDPLMPPPHAYVAFYLFMKYGFQADALVHIGTHGTHEWLPGKEAGLGPNDYSEALIMDMPNVYPYIVDNVGEGLQAKRRGQAVVVDHMTPPFDKSSLNPELRDLKSAISKYYDLRSKGPVSAGALLQELKDRIRAMGIDRDLKLDTITGQNLEVVHDYLKEIEESKIPLGLHTFGVSPNEEHCQAMADVIVAIRKDLDGEDLKRFREQVLKDIRESGPEELQAFIQALNGQYVPAGTGNDPIRNPSSLPTGKNFFAFDPSLIPSETTCQLGEKLAEELIAQYRAKHQGEYPSKVTVNLWAVECIRNEGSMEAQALSLLGVRPVYNSSAQVIDLELIPQQELKRPRVDVVFAPSGLYRDIFPELMALLDRAVTLVRDADEKNNFVREHVFKSKKELCEREAIDDTLACRLASVRLFTTPSGAYGTGVSGKVQASGSWESEKEVAEIYFDQMSHLYGQGFWGVKAEDQCRSLPEGFSKSLLKNALSGTRIALHSRSSNLYALLDNDDMFQFLGATALAVRVIDGYTPEVVVTNLIDPLASRQETLEKFLGRELKSRYLNPQWVDAMLNEGYAGARFVNKMIFNLWGWEATLPESVSDQDWKQIYDTYVFDKYHLNVKDRFREGGNLYAYQSILARLLETVRKGYWHAEKQVVEDMLLQFNETVREVGLACNLNVCNNESLSRFISDEMQAISSLTKEEKIRYQSALEALRNSSSDASHLRLDRGGNVYQLRLQDDRWKFKSKRRNQ